MSIVGVPGRNKNSLAYLSKRLSLVPVKQAPRSPTGKDRKYPLSMEWMVNKKAVLPDEEGDFWKLIKFDEFGNAIWIKIFSLSSGVNNVLGTTDRITSSGGTNPIIDIDSAYSGQTSIITLGEVITGIWNATIINTNKGGTGRGDAFPYGVICGGITSTSAHQSVASLGTSGQVLTSTGLSSLPTFQDSVSEGSVQSLTVPDGTSPVVPDIDGVIDITATSNIKVTGGTNAYDISVDGTTNHSVQVGNSGGSLDSLPVGSSDTVLIGNTGSDPTFSENPALNQVRSNDLITRNIPTNLHIFDNQILSGGSDTNVDMLLNTKGTGTVNASSLTVNSAYKFPSIDGAENHVLTTDGASTVTWKPTYNESGSIVQMLSINIASVVTVNTSIPNDNTIPQKTEGIEVLSLAITPISSTNNLIVQFETFFSMSSTGGTAVIALFRDDNNDALAAVRAGNTGATYTPTEDHTISHRLTAGSIAPTIFKIRIGKTAGSCFVNGSATGTPLYGGVASTVLSITEVQS